MTVNVFTRIIFASALLSACSTTQTADIELTAAEKALADAYAAKAKDCASATYQAAETKLREAKKLAAEEDVEGARAAAQEAERLAQQARGDSPPGCDEKEDEDPNKDASATDDVSRSMGIDGLEHTVYFDYNQATIREDSKALLTKYAKALKDAPALKLEIEGHCDSRGSTEYNLHLGERRARAVEKYLLTQGAQPSQLSIISYGEERPVDFDETEAAHQKNRRAELRKP